MSRSLFSLRPADRKLPRKHYRQISQQKYPAQQQLLGHWRIVFSGSHYGLTGQDISQDPLRNGDICLTIPSSMDSNKLSFMRRMWDLSSWRLSRVLCDAWFSGVLRDWFPPWDYISVTWAAQLHFIFVYFFPRLLFLSIQSTSIIFSLILSRSLSLFLFLLFTFFFPPLFILYFFLCTIHQTPP